MYYQFGGSAVRQAHRPKLTDLAAEFTEAGSMTEGTLTLLKCRDIVEVTNRFIVVQPVAVREAPALRIGNLLCGWQTPL